MPVRMATRARNYPAKKIEARARPSEGPMLSNAACRDVKKKVEPSPAVGSAQMSSPHRSTNPYRSPNAAALDLGAVQALEGLEYEARCSGGKPCALRIRDTRMKI